MSDADAFEQELEYRQNLIAEKLAEIGITVQLPVPFVKMPQGPLGGQVHFIWEDSAPVQQAIENDDEFAQIMRAEKEREKEEREEQRRKDEEQAMKDLAALAEGFIDDDD